MAKGAGLYRLQCLDSEADAKCGRLAKVKAALGESQALKQARRAVDDAQALIQRWIAQQRDLELQIQGIEDKASRSEQRLYSGTVKNPKELSDLQAETAALRRRRQQLEDDLLEAMIEREEAEVTLAQAQKRLDEIQTQWSAQQTDLLVEQGALEGRLAEIEQARMVLLPQIEATDLPTYQALRRNKGGVAVVQVDGGACGGCGIAVSPSLKWQLRQTGMANCDNCGRIIVQI